MVEKINYSSCKTSIGILWISEKDGFICKISPNMPPIGNNTKTPVITETILQLNEYFAGKRKEFTVPVTLDGTEFQQKVWLRLAAIPYGKTCTYKQIADDIGHPNAQRAVGAANNKNKILIIVPCHRVIGADGSLTGYAYGLKVKEFLLNLEKQNS